MLSVNACFYTPPIREPFNSKPRVLYPRAEDLSDQITIYDDERILTAAAYDPDREPLTFRFPGLDGVDHEFLAPSFDPVTGIRTETILVKEAFRLPPVVVGHVVDDDPNNDVAFFWYVEQP